MVIFHGFTILFVYIVTVRSEGYIELGNLPATVSVFEDAPGSTYVHSFTLYQTSSVNTVTCVFDPADSNYVLTEDGSGGQYHVHTAASPSLSAGTDSLTVSCADNVLMAVTSTLTVTVTANSAPVYANGADLGTVDVSAKTGKAGHVILMLDYTDIDTASPLPHQTILSVTPAPSATLFALAADKLSLVEDLLAYDDEATYEVEIESADERTTSTGTVTVNIIDRNNPPEFVLGVNPDVEIHLPEHTAGRLKVYDIDTLDAEGDAIQLTDVNTDPNIGAFDLVASSGEVILIGGEVLDYETVTQYVFHVTVEDHIDVQLTSTFTLSIIVDDINEQPTYSATPTAATINESAVGFVVGTLDVLCSDPDNDTITYTILFGTESTYFSIDPNTAEVSLAQDYDYDDTSLTNEVNLTIRCSDGRGLFDDTVHSVTIQDINDNNPVCNPSVTNFALKYDQTVNETLVNLACSDLDSTVNAELEYSLIGFTSGYAKRYFQVDTAGNVSISTAFDMDYNTSFYVTILINDRGVPPLSATVTLTVTYAERPIYVTYERIDECFLCTTSALTLVSVAGLFVFIILVYLIVLTILRCCYARERWKIKKALSKKKKRSWRWCGCLRPGELKKPKKRKPREVVKAELKDIEYMRARDKLQETEDPTLRLEIKKPPAKKRNIFAGVLDRIVYMGRSRERDQTPDLSATPVDRTALTSSQRGHLEKFKARTISHAAHNASHSKQAASDTVWSFRGRNT